MGLLKCDNAHACHEAERLHIRRQQRQALRDAAKAFALQGWSEDQSEAFHAAMRAIDRATRAPRKARVR